MKINKKIILLTSVLISILLVVITIVSPKSIMPETIAFLLLHLYLAPISMLGYDTCFMSGSSCVSDNVPFFVNFIGPIIVFIILTVIIYPIINFIARIILGLINKDFSDKVFSLKYYIKLFIFLFCILILSAFFYFSNMIETQNLKNEAEKEMIRTTAPEYVLKEYYESYIKYLNRIPESVDEYGNGILNDSSLGNRFVTNNVINKFNELKLQYPDGIPFNPFICAQDFPEDTSSLIVKEISNNGNIAKFEFYLFERPFIVTLVKNYDENSVTTDMYGNKFDVWKIDDINCNR